MELDLTEVAYLLGKLDEFGRKVDSAMEEGLIAAARVLQSEARRRAKSKKVRSKIYADKKVKRIYGGFEIWVKSKSPLGHFFESGTGIFGPKGHRIYPLRAKRLTFIEPKSGKWMNLKSTAGMKAKPYMKPALDNSVGAMMRVYQDAYNEKIG